MSSLYCYIQEGPFLPTFRTKISILDQSVRANELTIAAIFTWISQQSI